MQALADDSSARSRDFLALAVLDEAHGALHQLGLGARAARR
jgi:hypothetical protein